MPSRKENNRQKYYLAMQKEKKKKRQRCSTAIPDSSVSPFLSPLCRYKITHGRLEMYVLCIYVLCSLERWLHKRTKQSFLFICLSLMGKWRSEADAIATWTSCLNIESIFSFHKDWRKSWIIRRLIHPTPHPNFLPGTHIVNQMNDFVWGRNMAKNINLLLYTDICLEEKKESRAFKWSWKWYIQS